MNKVYTLTYNMIYIKVWTGTHGVLQLEDDDGQMVDIYLDDEGNQKVPVPRYLSLNLEIAIVGVNNPHKHEPNLCDPFEEVIEESPKNNLIHSTCRTSPG